MLQKRNDIQWLRAFAILAVLGFHLMPKTFPYGYLGVDIFFVISGYLMTCILSKECETLSFKTLLFKFYSRRICRIFPSYFIVLGLIFIAGKYLLLKFHFAFLSTEILWASFFVTNLKSLFKKETYFQLTSEYHFCLHTWSLGVEIQFYLIAPFLLTVIAASKAPLIRSFLVIIFSASLQLYFSKSPISFDFFLCRLWQFLSGTVAFYGSSSISSTGYTLLSPSGTQTTSKVSTCFYSTLFIFLSLLCFGPKSLFISEISQPIFRFLATFLTAVLIYIGTDFHPNIPLFCNKVFTYLGDISYAIYLYHWPIILFAKYSGLEISNLFILFGLLLLIFTVSIIHYHLIETKLPKLSPVIIYWIITFLFAIILYFSIANYGFPSTTKAFIDDSSQLPLNDSEAIRINSEMATTCNQIPIKCEKDNLLKESFKIIKKDDNFEGRCVLNLSKNGKKTVILIGNSYAMRHIDAIVTALNTSKHSNTFSKIYLVSWKGCTVFESTYFEIPKIYECEKVKGLLIPFLEKLRPSLIIMLNRLDFLPAFNTPLNSTDKTFINFQNDFLIIANISSQTIVFEPHHTVGATMKAAAITLATKISQKTPLFGLDRNATDVHKELDLSWTKMKAAMSSCNHCHIFEILKYFCDEKICETFDRKNRLSYFCDGYHFTSVATKKFIEPLKTLINTLEF